MFGLKSKKEKLEAKYRKLLEESYRLSTSDRARSDAKLAEAEELRRHIDGLNAKS
ncbi:MAG: Lacal_2735 family protein [Planctomycetota bacterium]